MLKFDAFKNYNKGNYYGNFKTVEQLRNYYNITGEGVDGVNEGKEEEESNEEQETPTQTNPQKNPLHPEKWGEKVEYSKIDKYECIFKHIIVLTNSRDPKDNKTLKNIIESIKDFKKDGSGVPEIHVFVADEVVIDEKDNGDIYIEDSKNSMTIKEESNIDTLVFSRLGVQNTQCESVTQVLQDRGFLVLNPLKYSKLASDKYDTAVLLQRGNIPQPNFCLMTRDILYNEESYESALKSVHPSWEKDSEENDKLEYVIKILDGHGGTGVACITGKGLLSILQLIFAIDPERRIIIQAKEEADGGDIRVHVLTLRNKQKILACMKRVKLSGDFRSNVSLGASAEPVKLTPAQEQIALRAAKLSRLPWCAVDIMPLVKGSNKELGDNVVLEINASPGTDGISDVIEENFISILVSELNDPSEFYIQEKVAGYKETIQVDLGNGSIDLLAKLDTGNGAKASCLEVGEYEEKDGVITFTLFNKKYQFDKVDTSNAIAGDTKYNRPIIVIPEIRVGKRKIKNAKMGIVTSRDKNTNVLINRDDLSRMGYIINPNCTHILTKEIEKIKIL